MFRNKEIKVFCSVIGIISIIGAILGFLVSFNTGILVIILEFLLVLSFIIFTKWRYDEIRELSNYIDKIVKGNYSFDIRDNVKGELSILKNDIYKVTMKLFEQKNYLKKDKIHLADAISDISHQLKTPLTSMMIMMDLLSKPNLQENTRLEFVESIRNQLERIEWLVTSLLKLSKIDAGTVYFKKDIVNVSSLIKSSLEPLLIPIEIKELKMDISIAIDSFFIGDFNWSREAMINILKNCIEHTENKGMVSIICTENPIYLEILIRDTGKGIAKKDIPYIFKRFYKGSNSSENSIGIGLAMSKTIIREQGGDITVKSKLGVGSEFSIKIYKQTI